jgi:hypothetical protein
MLRRVSVTASVFVLCLIYCGAPGVLHAQQGGASSPQTASIVHAKDLDAKDQRKLAKIRKLEDFKKELGGGSLQAESFKKLEGVLLSFLKDPETEGLLKYEVLLQLSDLYVRDPNRIHSQNAIHYLLRAALEDPDRVEAYLRLAQIYGHMGDSQQQARYLSMAHQIVASRGRYAELAERFQKLGDSELTELYVNRAVNAPQSLEAWYLLGQYYLDRGNYFAVLTALRPVACDRKALYYWGDPYLINQMYRAATLDLNTFQYWAPPLWAAINRKSPSQVEERIQQVFRSSFDQDVEKTRLAKRMRDNLMPYLRNAIDVSAQHEVQDPTSGMPTYKVKAMPVSWGSPQSPLRFDKRPEALMPELFVRASVSASPGDLPEKQSQKEEQVRKLTQRIGELKKTAEEKFGSIEDPEKKARALFDWLKSDVLVNYALVEGIPAENVLNPEKKKYLCLTGAIMYTLLARHLDLDVVGCLGPGHAYCRFNNKGRSIIIETTDRDGFDYKKEDKRHQAGARYGGILFSREMEGPVSPWELVSCQFSNVAGNLPRLLILENPTYKNLAVKVFKGMPRDVVDQIKAIREEFERHETRDPTFKWQGEFTPEDCLQTWFLAPLGDNGVLQLKLIKEMGEENPAFKKDVIAKYEESLDVLARGMQIEPFGGRFRQAYLQQLEDLERIDTQTERDKVTQLGVTTLATLRDLEQEIEDLQVKLKSQQRSREEEDKAKARGDTYADLEKRIKEKRNKFFSLLKEAAEARVELATVRLASLERRRTAMKYCPPIPELGQEYLKSINSAYRDLGEIAIYCDGLKRIWPDAPEQDLQNNLRKVQELRFRLEQLASST